MRVLQRIYEVRAMSNGRMSNRQGRIAQILACLLFSAWVHGQPQATENASSATPRWAIGVLAHDQGPFSDHNEHGIDLNLEVQFAPLKFIGSPRPHLGATLNFTGDTSAAYGGLSFPFLTSSHWLLEGALGIALHNGPLHKDAAECRQNSDCGFGTRLLPRLGLEFGYRLDERSAVTLLYDHMSHKGIIGGENEGIDHIGLRYLRRF